MPSERDLEVAKLCVSRGYATAEQVRECLSEASAVGETMRPLEAVLRRRGYITEEVYREISSSHRRAAVSPVPGSDSPRKCASCGTAYSGELCPKCVAGFAQIEEADDLFPETVVVAPRLPGAPPPDERPAAKVDPEVEKAAQNPKNRLGKYVLVRELGAGGMGVVFKAWQTDLRRFVALKFIRGVESQHDLERFLREAQLAATLSHPGIAPIYESGEHEGKHYFAMQYVDGTTLDRLLASRDRPQIRKVVEVLATVAEAVEYAHEHGIIHRDLKPQNVMVDARGRTYVMDFGLAKSVRTGSSLTGSGFAVGTPSYMPPEQAQGDQARIGPASDVYALGAILYHAAAGVPPFEGENAIDVLRRVVDEEPAPPRRLNPKLHPDLETIALKSLEKDPARRYATAAEFRDELRRWLEGEPILARPVGTLSRMIRRVRKHKSISVAVASLLVALAVAAGSLTLRHREKSIRAAAVPYLEEAMNAYGEADKIRTVQGAAVAGYRPLLVKAEKAAAEAVRLDSEYAEAHLLLGQIIARRDAYDPRALAEFDRSVELEPGSVRARLERGLWRMQLFLSRYGLDSVSRRTKTEALQFSFKTGDAGFEQHRAEIVDDLNAASRLSAREAERTLLEGAVEFVSWRTGQAEPLERARKHLTRAMELSPNDYRVQVLLGWVQLARGDPKRAADQFAGALRLAPNDHALLYHAAGVFLLAERLDEALDAANLALDVVGPHYQILNVRANVRLAMGEDQKALDDFAKAIRLTPTDPVAYANAGYVLHKNGSYPEAVKAYTDALDRRADDPDYLEARGMTYLMMGRYEEAERDMDKVVTLRPNGGSYSNRGAARSRREKFAEAMEDYERALRLSPDDAGVPYNVGVLFARQKRWAEAVPHYRRALELGRTQAETWSALGQALLELRRWAEAEEAYTKVLEERPRDASAFLDRCRAKGEQGRFAEALVDALEAMKLRPEDPRVLRDVGVSHAKLRHAEEAVPYLEKAIEKGKSDVLPLLAEMYFSLNRVDEAEKTFTRAIEELKDRMAYFGRARVRHALGRLDDAVADLDEALRIDPRFAAALGFRGVVQLGRKRYADSAVDLRRAIELQPELRRAFQPFLDEAIEAGKKP